MLEFSPLPRDGNVGIVKRHGRERKGDWTEVEIALAVFSRRGWHEWDFSIVDGKPNLVCEAEVIYGPRSWNQPTGTVHVQEQIGFASGTGGACGPGQGFRTKHLTDKGWNEIGPEAACLVLRDWESKGLGGSGTCRAE
jgi:hypothetical protein